MGELLPAVRITATYAATDGSMPESVEIVWETAFPSTVSVQEVVRLLISAPQQVRNQIHVRYKGGEAD